MSAIYSVLPVLQAQPAGGGEQLLFPLVTFGLIAAIMYFLIIRPQNKRQKEQQKMIDALKKGDRVATIGGIRGTVVGLKEDTVVLKVDDNVKLEFSRSSVSSVLEKKAKGGGKQGKQAQSEEGEEPDEQSETEESN
ncbi:MAG: preprotein translocase subunit YajC [Spirochaetales bacterium]